MPTVTVLCAPRDYAVGDCIAGALARRGLEPHWPAHAHDAGDLALDEDAAIVVWSDAALPLLPFHEKARAALARDALIPVVIDGADSPDGFETVAPVDLTGWSGEENDPRWRFVLDEIELVMERRQRVDGRAAEPTPYANGESSENIHYLHGEDAPRDDADAVLTARRQAAPLRIPLRAVGLFGAAGLVAMAAAAALLIPARLDKTAPAGGRLAFVQPASPEGEPPTGADAEADFEITVTRAPGAGADAAPREPAPAPTPEPGDDAQEAAPVIDQDTDDQDDGVLEAPSENFPAEEAEENAAAPKTAIAPSLAAARAEPDPAAMERLVASVAGPGAGAGAPAGSARYFRDCAACPDMAAIPAGRFLMGSPRNEPARKPSEGPRHEVAIARGFALGAREVTFAEWDACVADGGCRTYKPFDHGWGRGARPVINVSFEDAEAYVQWLSQKTGESYRLPSEAEWEYAARAGVEGPFGFAGLLTAQKANYDARFPYGGPVAEARGKTAPTASYPPNAFGLYDMQGNVWEWTEDCWAETLAGAPADGAARSGSCAKHALKGGAWNTGGWRLRAGHRIGKSQTAREFDNGFRVARDMN